MDTIFESDFYSICRNKVIQGSFQATAITDTALVSDYQSPLNLEISPLLLFKFSINGKDNEMAPGKNHQINLAAAYAERNSPLIRFAEEFTDPTVLAANVFLQPDTPITIRLDMNGVLQEFTEKGFYTAYNGSRIYQTDFKGVFIAGNISPLHWDFDNLATFQDLQLHDKEGNGIYTISLIMNKPQQRKTTATSWKLSRDIAAFPQYQSGFPIMNAVYNMALEEMENAIEADGTFRTGQEWAGVWTRDISYSIILSMAMLQPEVARHSLMMKVKNTRIVQDTGTGGSWPVSSDRIVWAIAAWEVYKITADESWLAEAYQIIRNSIDDDLKTVYDEQTGLVRGESSFLDWRDQTYPKWMQCADIYSSLNLGTNALHYQANIVLSEMAKLLNDEQAACKHAEIAKRIKQGINTHLWMEQKGYYGQYLYGRQFKSLSPRAEALGEALSVLFDIADPERQKSITACTPVTNYGIPCIYPQIPGMPPYHNNGVWPFVQAYWSLAVAKTGNEEALLRSLSAIYRPAALFLTNKENFVSTSGDFAGTQVNSSNMLWSLAGNLSMVYNVLFGIDIQEDGLLFKPFVPKVLGGERRLSNFKYRQAVLDISMSGFGNLIETILLNGTDLPDAKLPSDLSGNHHILIKLANNSTEIAGIAVAEDYFSVDTPIVKLVNNQLSWTLVKGAATYLVIHNGHMINPTTALTFAVKEGGEYQVIAVDANGVQSFASEPVLCLQNQQAQIYFLNQWAAKSDLPYLGFTGSSFVEISKSINQTISIPINIAEAGIYAVDCRYANGNGPINTENKCAIRTLNLDGQPVGTLVFPQRGKDEWSDWGFSNTVCITLQSGTQQISLSFESWNENMNGELNQAMLDYLRIIRIS